MNTTARMRGYYVGIEKNGGNFIPLIRYKPEWGKLQRFVDSNHFFGKHKGYAIHKVLLDFMVGKFGRDAELVTIKNNTGEKFYSHLKDWQDKGILMDYQGEQVCLPVAYMKSNKRQINGKITAKKINWEEERLSVVAHIKSENVEEIGLFARI